MAELESQSCSIGGDCATGGTHEFQHFSDLSKGLYAQENHGNRIPSRNTGVDEFGDVITRTFSASEIPAVYSENEARAASGYSLRMDYDGVKVFGMEQNFGTGGYFYDNGLKSQIRYTALKSIKSFSFNPNLTLPSSSKISNLYKNISISPVKKENYSTGGKKNIGVRMSTRNGG